MSALNIIAEAILRVEYKLDAIMKYLKIAVPQPMKFIGHQCPVCLSMVEYQVDLEHGVVKRKCDCSTGKQPPIIPLIPVTPQEKPNARREPEPAVEAAPEDSRRRKER